MRVHITRVPDGKITLQETSKFAIVTINRPAARNALTSNMWNELCNIGKEIKKNPKVKVVIVRGVPGDFTAGSDIKEFAMMSVQQANATFDLMEQTISTFESLTVPVIAAVDGPALGSGFVLSLACDLRIGTDRCRMGIPVSRLGITLGPAFVRRIVRLIGPSRTKEIVYLNQIYDSQTALTFGLLNSIVSSNELDQTVFQYAESIKDQSRASLEAIKKSVELSYWTKDIPWNSVDPTDFSEGCLAFIEKRKPLFR